MTPHDTAAGPEFVTVGFAADLLGVSVSTVRALLEAGDLDGYTLPSGHRRVRYASLRALLDTVDGGPE